MSKHSVDKTIKVLGIDIGKNTFHLHGINKRGNAGIQRSGVEGLICLIWLA